MIDVVYPLKSFTKHNCAELKYSLRSVEKYLKNIRDVYVVTDELPKWITGVKVLKAKDYPGMRNKEFNICCKISTACLHPEVSNPFLFMNDDHYLLTEYNAATFPYYYFGIIATRLIGKKETDIYYQSCRNTEKYLVNQHRNTKYFDIHSPILYEKEQFLRIMKAVSWKDNCGYVIKSLYGNMMSIEGQSYTDCKLTPPFEPEMIKDRLWFSNGNLVIKEPWFEVMECLFPNKSRFEL